MESLPTNDRGSYCLPSAERHEEHQCYVENLCSSLSFCFTVFVETWFQPHLCHFGFCSNPLVNHSYFIGFWNLISSSAEMNIRIQHCVLEHHSMKYKGRYTLPEWDSSSLFWAPKESKNLYQCLLQGRSISNARAVKETSFFYVPLVIPLPILHQAVIQQLSPPGQVCLSEPGAWGRKPVQELQKKSSCSGQLMLLLQAVAQRFYSRANMDQKFYLLGSSSEQGCPGWAIASVRL